MEELITKQKIATQALARLKRDLDLLENDPDGTQKYYEQFRSSTIQSFECAFDTLWKYANSYLALTENIKIEFASPKKVFKACWENGLINEYDFETLNELVADRNLTTHSYNEETAEEILWQLKEHCAVMEKLLNACGQSN